VGWERKKRLGVMRKEVQLRSREKKKKERTNEKGG